MWVGASPGSTGGGLKTVTLAVLILGVICEMKRRKHAELLGRRIPDDQMRQAVAMTDGRLVLEASGNMTLPRVAEVAATGVDYISSGALTHSAKTLDLGLDF